MKVSIIIPNLNYARYLPDCLNSIASQSYPAIEVIMLDGGSTDGSDGIMQEYAQKYGWHYERNPGQGHLESIEHGLSIASGDIHAWLNSDDYYISHTSIERVVSIFEQMPTVSIYSGGGYYVDAGGHFIKPAILLYHPALVNNPLKRRGGFIQPSTFWRKQVTQTIPFNKNYRYCFDVDFLIRAAQQFNLLTNQYTFLSAYRLHGQNLSMGVKADRILEIAHYAKTTCKAPFAAVYLKLLASVVKLTTVLPNPLRKWVQTMLYRLNNALSFLSVYKIPSI